MIYQPAEDSHLLQEFVKEYSQGRILDMGTGSGVQALTAMENPNSKEIIAIDINKEAVDNLNQLVKEKNFRKIEAIQGDLFENVHGQFHLIIFNPPYLPQDKGIEDRAIYGGKKGWEISERFFSEASKYLLPDGTILFLFSSLTNKEKIEEILANNLLQFEQKATHKLNFETLYVYKIKKTSLLRKLEGRGLENVHYFTKGKRGVIYTASLDKSGLIKTHLPSKKDIIKVAIKVKREDSHALGKIENEVKWLKKLQKENICPRFVMSGDLFVAYQFVEGNFILDWIKTHQKEEIKKVLKIILDQCFTLDKIGVNKEEMHHPLKHIIMDKNDYPIMIDFERCSETDNPKNVTQFIEFICRINQELHSKNLKYDLVKLRELAKEYKETYSLESFQDLKNNLK